jgi:hypothetical protein
MVVFDGETRARATITAPSLNFTLYGAPTTAVEFASIKVVKFDRSVPL